MADLRSLISQIPMEPGYVPAPLEPDLSVIQRLIGLPQTLRAVGQNLAVGAASLPYGIYQGFGNPAAGEAAMSQFQQEYGYTPTNPAAQRQLQGLGEFLQQLETEYKIPPMISPSQLPSRAATAGSAMQLGRLGTSLAGQSGRLARELVREIQTTPPTGAVQLAPTPGLLEKSDIGFYSQLEAAVQPLQNKGTGQQYLAQIQKSAGVKPEEIQWTGLDEFLKSKQSVTKQEVQDYLAANRVNVQEVRLGRTPAMVRAERDAAFGAYDRGEITLEQRNAILEQSEPRNTRHHLGAYKGIATEIPGGENYREILLTLPGQWEKPRALQQANSARIKELRDQMYGTSGSNEIRAEISRLNRENELLQKQINDAPIYKSSHFDQPNILAHLRVNDRTVDGKKTLFVEEIQSDWHQAGRKKGYDTPEAKAAEQQKLDNILAERQGLLDEQRRLEELALPYTSQGKDAPSDIVDRWSAVSNRINNLQTEQNRLGRTFGQQVPDAPFKTTWHELSLKRAIQEASEKGYDQIAFTTGKTQAARYDLSKQVDSLLYTKNPDGTYRLSAQVQGEGKMLGQSIPEADLENYVGKEIAAKIAKGTGKQTEVAGKYDPVSMTSSRSYMTELSGEGLKIGGEGMKGFYDNILPKSLEKLGKKFGAKVGKTFIEGGYTMDADGIPSMYPEKIEVWQMDITPKMRESVTTKGQPLFAIPAIGTGLLGAEMMQEEQQY